MMINVNIFVDWLQIAEEDNKALNILLNHLEDIALRGIE